MEVFLHACWVASVMSDSLQPYGLQPGRLLCPWDSPGKNTGGGCHALFQGIFPAQELKLSLLPSNTVSLAGRFFTTSAIGKAQKYHYYTLSQHSRASLVAQLVRNLPVMWETWIQSLGWDDPLEKGKATHSSILAWRIPWTM